MSWPVVNPVTEGMGLRLAGRPFRLHCSSCRSALYFQLGSAILPAVEPPKSNKPAKPARISGTVPSATRVPAPHLANLGGTMRSGMLPGCTHNRPATRNGRLKSGTSERASTSNEDSAMNSGRELCQSGSRTAKTVAIHCNVQTAPCSARAVHFRLLKASCNLCRRCHTISATSRTWMHSTVSCQNHDTADASTYNRITAAHPRPSPPTQRTAR
jgi:hypothetical protein